METIAVANSVQHLPHSHVPLTQSLGLDCGTGHSALQEAVGVRVREVFQKYGELVKEFS